MSNDKTTLADVQPGGRVRLGDRPKDGEVLVKVLGLTGSGKSAIAGEIEILCKALGLEVEWVNGDEEKRLTHADWIGALEMYKPKVVIAEQNIPRAALSAQLSPGGQGGLNYERMFVDACAALAEVSRELGCDPEQGGAEPILAAISELREALAARQPVGEPVDDYDSAFQEPDHPPYLVDAAGYYALQSFLTVAEEFRRSAEPYIEAINEGACGGEDEVSQAFDTQLARAKEAVSRSVAYAAPPAQAVNLGGLREILESWKNSDYPFSYEGQCAQRALDACIADLKRWLDSQAVGNG
ncbi:hypothetical protein [Stenotrophomonas hibiscicola]|uniref:hypothetical protein n=1 Tax=Stenotrophomonas hibiscicola TaxID=86189 RepID=UPI00320EE768